jgi:hypothetical protein
MANDIVIPAGMVIPAYLKQYQPTPDALSEYQVPGADPIAVLSLKGKAFTIRFKGEKFPCLDAQGMRGQYVDLIVAKANKFVTKTFWEEGYDENNPAAPDCFSFDGIKPEPNSPKLQNPVCHGCKQNQWNTRGKGKACKDGKKLAVLQVNDVQGELYGGPQLMRIPPDSFNGFRRYSDELLRNGLWPHAVVTRIWFDTDAIFRINFQFIRCIDEEEAAWVETWRTHPDYAPVTDRILSLPEFDFEEVASPGTEASPAPSPQPQPVRSTVPRQEGPARPRPADAAAAQAPQQQPAQPQRPQPQRPQPAQPVRPQPAQPVPAPKAPPAAAQVQSQAPVPAPAQAAPQRPRQAAPASGATQAPVRPVPAAGGPSRAPQRPVPAGNGQAGVATSAPARPAAPAPVRPTAPARPGVAAAAAPVRPAAPAPAPAPAAPVAEEYADEAAYDVDEAVDGISTGSLMAALDNPPGVPGE